MIYFEKDGLIIRDLTGDDVAVFVAEERAQGWANATPEKLEMRIGHREKSDCILLAAEVNGAQAGYVSLYRRASSGPFAGMNIPEIVDFNVLVRFRRRGIGTALMDVCERLAKETCDRVCLGVGLYRDYGPAQRLYIKRGYVPDGTGVWYEDKNLEPYADCCNDDSLVLYLIKQL